MSLESIAVGKRILLLDGFCKQCLPFLRGFKELGCEVTIVCNSKLDCGYVSRLPDHRIISGLNIKDDVGAELLYRDLAKSGQYDLVLPLFDNTSKILSSSKEELSKYLIVYVNDNSVFDRANDKNEVMRECMENGLPCPRTLFGVKNPEDVAKGGLQYPIIIKPRKSYGGRGFHPFENEIQLREYVTLNNIDLSEYVVQERIPADRIGLACNVFVDRDGEPKSCFSYVCLHMYPEVGGTSTLNAFIDRPDVTDSCTTLIKRMGIRGIVGVDVMIDRRDNIGKIIEINVRPPHGIAIGFKSGINLCRQILEDAYGLPVTKYDAARTDFCMRIGQTDVLWYLTSPDRFKKTPRKMGYKKVYEQMFFWDDPLPWFAFLVEGIIHMRKTMKEKRQ